jgi:hypothetical protein
VLDAARIDNQRRAFVQCAASVPEGPVLPWICFAEGGTEMRRQFIAICALAAASAFHPAHAQTLYAFLVADTNDPAAGSAFEANILHLKGLLGKIEKIMTVKTETVVDNQFNCRTIAARLNKPSIEKSDAVLFYYTGGGFQTSGKFPEFDCRRSWQDRNRVGLASVAAHFTKMKKKPRLVVAIADTHNKKQSRRAGPEPERKFGLHDAYRPRLLEKLFLEGKGTYVITAAKAGEDANFVKGGGEDAGGFFTNQFLEALDQWSKKGLEESATWELVLATAARPIPIPEKPPTQTPYLKIQKPRE